MPMQSPRSESSSSLKYEFRLVHYSEVTDVCVREYDQFRRMTDGGSKPDGFWFSAGDGSDGWQAYVEKQVKAGRPGFSLAQLNHQTEVVFRDSATCLFLSGSMDIDAFTCEYGSLSDETHTRVRGNFPKPPRIDWPRVASNFDAIIIAPLCVDRLNDPDAEWYRCWDVSCGCVWNSQAVDLKPLTYRR